MQKLTSKKRIRQLRAHLRHQRIIVRPGLVRRAYDKMRFLQNLAAKS